MPISNIAFSRIIIVHLIFGWLLRRNIYREIARPIEVEVNTSLQSTRNTLESLVGRVETLDRTTIPDIQSMAQNLENQYEEVKQEIITSGEIINRVKKQLDIGLATAEEKKRLKEDINNSPNFVQDNVFYIAKDFMIDNFRKGNRLKELEKAIPIFEAFIENDHREVYFRSRAYLGYAHAYKNNPNFDEAIKCIDEAIKIRDNLGKVRPEFYFYEFKRSIYKIQKYGCIQQSMKMEDKKYFSEIISDLEIGNQYQVINKLLIEDIQSGRNFDQDSHGRYLTEPEFVLLKEWYKINPNEFQKNVQL